jgi:hypothetical protein
VKITKISALILALLLLFTGCGSGGSSAADVADHIKSLSPANITWVEIDRSKISTYFGISSSSVTDFKGYINSSDVCFDLVAVFEFEGKDEHDAIINGAKTLAEQMSGNYSLVNVEESAKISQMLIFEKGNFVIVYVADNSEDIKDYLQNSLKATEI